MSFKRRWEKSSVAQMRQDCIAASELDFHLLKNVLANGLWKQETENL